MIKNYLTFILNKYSAILVFVFAFLFTNYSFAQSPFVDNTPGGSETFIVPTGVTSITASIWGAGGGGGGSNSNNDGGSGGGGGGATTIVIAVTPGDTFTYTVGTGGNGGLSTAGIGGNGTNTTFINVGLGINLLGNGGTGGGPNRGAAGTGGTASGGTTNMTGQNGTVGDISGQVGGNSGAVVGIFGFGGAAVTNSTGNPGTIPGGGGSGGERGGGNRAGGAGANGQVRITFTCPTYVVNAGPDQTLVACATTATLAGSAIPVGTTGTWTLISGAATITNPNLPNTGITGLIPGTPATLRWTITNGTCGNTTDDVIITPVVGGGCTPYCIPNYTTSVDPITNVNFAGINNPTSNVVNGTPAYQIFYTPTGTVEQGETYPISISGNTVGNNTYGIRVFFDWNQDGDFLDGGETFDGGATWSLNNTTGGPSFNNYITVPIAALTGTTRMRVTFMRGAFSGSCTVGAQRGQIEDYLVNITPVSCRVPTAILAGAITGTTATISWTAPAPAPSNGYDYYISTVNAAPGTIAPLITPPTGSVGAGITSVNLTGLTPGMIYYVWVRGNCGGGDTSVWSASINFTTTLGNNECAGAIIVPVNAGANCESALEGTTNTATASAESGVTCAGTEDDDVWYKFVATAVNHRISVIPGHSPAANGDYNFEVFAQALGNCATKVNVGCAAVAAGATETLSLVTVIGTTYFVRVYTSSNSAALRGNFTICVTTGNATHSSNSAAVGTYTIHPTAGYSNRYINDYNTTGPMTNTVNMNTGRYITGYKDYTALTAATQVPNGGVNIDIYLARSRQNIKAWVDWNNDGTFTNAAPELVYSSGGVQSIATSFGFVVPGGTAPGNYRVRVRSYEFAIASLLPYGYLENGETEDYTLTVIPDCTAKITSVTDGTRCDTGTVNLVATAAGAPTQFRWYDSETGGSLVGTSATGNWTTPSISTTTTYWVTAFNGCESLLRTKVIATVYSTAIIFVTPSVPEVCGENNIISITAAGDFIVTDLINEKFETAGSLGTMSSIIIGGAGDALTRWQQKSSVFVPVGSVWKPAISSREAGNGFAFATSDYNLDVNTSLQSATFDTTTFTDLTLTFRHYYSYYGVPYDGAFVEVSTDGGVIWNPVLNYNSDQAVASNFQLVTVNMNAYINQPTLTIRFRYNAKFCDGWAIDDVRLFGNTPLNTTFSWSGGAVDAFIDGACTIPYVAQSVSTVFVRPTPAQLAAPSWSFTATATLFNGCPVSRLITINNKTKLWTGTASDDWYNANNWSPVGVPDANTCVVVYNGPFDSKINTIANDAFAKYVIVRPSGDLQILPGNDLTITDQLTVEPGGIFNLENSANLIQVNNTTNTGSINMRRNTNIKQFDYVYWSTPVASFSSSAISPASTFLYKWEPTTITGYASNFGNWANGSEAMTLGRGYIVRAPSSYGTVASNYTATFTGVPNNGDITTPISRSTYVGAPYAGPTSTLVTLNDDNWNLIGNPYPSSISADAFLTNNSTKIAGFIRIWTHGTPPISAVDPFYQNYTYNYVSSDYITYNLLGGTVPGFDGYIPAGQGFFTLMQDAAATPNTVGFTNSMRSSAYRNDQFYKTAENKNKTQVDKHRIWLDLLDSSKTASRTLVGYATNATNSFDNLYDAVASAGKSKFELYSIIDLEEVRIQGKSLPFNQDDQIKLGFAASKNDTYTIAIAYLDGLFKDKDQKILLEDTYLKVTHELSATPYEFSSDKGKYNDRFILKYSKKESTTTDVSAVTSISSVNVYTTTSVNVKSTEFNIKTVEVFDIQGKKLFNTESVNKKELEIAQLRPTLGALLVRVTLVNGDVQTKKIIY
ncbi:T9SS sorting signal type C domain-containing protein [Flavobacterium amnicola]|uniref:T9SS sorting signal type C domain-containing protein n=1 Tax=Flavobacterium amnicola TaxID=2506422 RepID=A0A4Q1K5N3_9FLAO|nr:GEVED domain-containing protein [Flavobacterium amnicola]RXR20474.1 T9SS sorting signal type C domain-containing protein [Flavobacterium amnicola]